MVINHKEAYELAFMKASESNLARAYLDLVDILVSVTHHDGALQEYESRWLPIVQTELSRRHQYNLSIEGELTK